MVTFLPELVPCPGNQIRYYMDPEYAEQMLKTTKAKLVELRAGNVHLKKLDGAL